MLLPLIVVLTNVAVTALNRPAPAWALFSAIVELTTVASPRLKIPPPLENAPVAWFSKTSVSCTDRLPRL